VYGPTCGPPFVRENAAFGFVSQPLGTNAYWNQKQTDRHSIAVSYRKSPSLLPIGLVAT
jgi:hypothetical protein